MYITVSEHCKQQQIKRKPTKNEWCMIVIFKEMLDCYKNKRECRWHKVKIYDQEWKYWPLKKIVCWKYSFVYSVNWTEYLLVTFLVKDDRLTIWNTTLNLNWEIYWKQLN